MKKTFSNIGKGIALAAVLVVLAIFGNAPAPIHGQQNFISEISDIVFRRNNPTVKFNGTLAFQNTAGTQVASLTSGGVMTGAKNNAIVTTAATRTLTAAECGSTIVGNATTGTQVFTLPAATEAGCRFTFIAGHADTEIQFKSAAVATCVFTHFAAVGADADTAIVTDASCEGGIKNTAATNAIGDSITIISDGTRWLGVGIASGIWAVV